MIEVKEIKIKDLRRADYNPREKSEHVLASVRQSIKEYGFLQPVVVNTHECGRCGDRRNMLVGGHRRIDAAEAEELESVPAVFVNLHAEDEKRANLRLNAQEQFKRDQLASLITELHSLDAESAGKLGFSAQEVVRLLFEARYQTNKLQGILQEKFLIPPFSIFDAKQGYWQKRKRQWMDLLGNLAETRETKLAGGENNLLMRGINSGVSIFDPVVSEVVFLWFLPEGGGTRPRPVRGKLGARRSSGGFKFGLHGRRNPSRTNRNERAEIKRAWNQSPLYLR